MHPPALNFDSLLIVRLCFAIYSICQLACGYINSPAGTNKTEDAAACMSMCLTHADFIAATITPGTISENGIKLGLKDNMSGIQALNLIR